MDDAQTFAIRTSPVWRPLLLAAGVTRARARVTVGADDLRVIFGFFDRTYPLASIASVSVRGGSFITGVGIHTDFRGGVFLNGDFGEVTEITFREPQRARLPIPMRYRRLGVTLEDARSFVDALRRRAAIT